MKKILSIIAVACLLGSLAFADDAKAGITIGGWGRLIWAPVISNNAGIGSGIGTSWGSAPRIGFTIAGNSEFVGFAAHIGVDNNSFSITDDTQAWIKPLPGLMLQVGRAFNDTLRGSVGFGDYNWIRSQWYGDDGVFKRIGGAEGGGSAQINAILSYSIAGLFVYVEQSLNNGANLTTWGGVVDNDPNGVYANMSFGAGYTIEGFGQIRLQKVGYGDLQKTTYGYYQAAVKVNPVKEFYLDVGLWIPYTVSSLTDSAHTASALAGWTFQVPLYVKLSLAPATIHALFVLRGDDTSLGYSSNISFNSGLGLDLDMGDGLGLNASVRYKSHNFGAGGNDGFTDTVATPQTTGVVSALLGITKGFSNGMIGIGVQISTSSLVAGMSTNQASNQFNFAIPVRFEYWF